MRNLKKVISVVLVFALMLSLTVFAGAAGFADVPDNHQYKNAIDLLSALNILGGYEDGTFKPDKEITRAEFAKILYVIYQGVDDLNATLFSGETIFTDVAKNQWFAGYVNWAVNSGIVGGYGDGTFMPDNKIKVKEAIKMIVAAVTDKTLVYPMGHIQEAKAQKLLKGVDISDIDANATRGQIAQMAYNLLTTPSKLCLKSKGYVNGVEQFDIHNPMTYVFNLQTFEGEVIVEGSYDNKFIASQTLNQGQVALEVKGDKRVVNYSGDVSDLLGQSVTVYYKDVNENKTIDDKDVIFSIVNDSVVLNTTLKGLTLSGTTFKVNGTTITPNVVGGVYKFEKVFKQDANFNFAAESDLAYTSYFKGTKSDAPVTLVDIDADGDYEYLYIYNVVNGGKVDGYNKVNKNIKLGSKTVKFENVIGLDGIALNDIVNYTGVINGKNELVVTIKKADSITGTVTAIGSNNSSVTVGGKSYTANADYKNFSSDVANKLNAEVKLYFDSIGNVVKVEAISEVVSSSKLNLAYVKAVTDDYSANRDGTKTVTATMTVVLPDGTEKTITVDTKNATFSSSAAGWKKAQPEVDSNPNDGDGYTEYYWEYTKNAEGKFTTADIVGKYIHYELDTNGKLNKVVALADIETAFADTTYTVRTFDKDDNLSYSDEYGFYKLVGKTAQIIEIPADNIVGMYYDTSKKAADVYTKATLPEFESGKGDYTLIMNGGKVVAFIINSKGTVTTTDTVFGILKSFQKVSGAGKDSNGNPTTRYALTMSVDGKDVVYYTKDGVNLLETNLTTNRLVTLTLKDGKVDTDKVDSDYVAKLDYAVVGDYNYAVVESANAARTAFRLYNVTEWEKDTAAGYVIKNSKLEWQEAKSGKVVIDMTSAKWLTVADETTIYQFDGKIDNGKTSNGSARFMSISKLSLDGEIIITENIKDPYEVYIIAYKTFTSTKSEADADPTKVYTEDSSLNGCLASVIVFTTPILVFAD